jgi:hypothetical protein
MPGFVAFVAKDASPKSFFLMARRTLLEKLFVCVVKFPHVINAMVKGFTFLIIALTNT